MVSNSGSPGHKYDFLEQLSIEDLERLLCLDSDSEEADRFMDAVAEVIIRREREHPTGRLMNVDEAWKEFQTVYNVPGRQEMALLDTEKADIGGSSPANSVPQRATSESTHFSFRRTGRTFGVVAATIAVVFAVMIGAQAVGADVFGALARLTDETFSFITSPRDRDESIGLKNTAHGPVDVQRILGEYAPTWYPEGAEAIGSWIQEDEYGVCSQVSFSLLEDRFFFIRVDEYRSNNDIDIHTFERDAIFQKEYSSHSRVYHIFSNEDHFMGIWTDGRTLNLIRGDLSIEELESIIDSIGG